jgi:hypothetical protein
MILTSSVRADDYKIKLIRPDKVGDQYTSAVTSRVTETVVSLQNGEETDRKTEKFNAECQGTVKVLAVDEKTGFATKIRYQIDKLARDGKDLYPAGTVIIAKRDGDETSYEIDGEHPDETSLPIIASLLDLPGSRGMTTEAESNAIDKPQAVGATWPINTSKVAKDISNDQLAITADELKGESKLVSVKKVDGQDVMVVKATISADGFKKDLPNGGSVSDGKMSAEITNVLPVDDTQPAISSSSKITVTVTVNPPLGASKSVVTTKRERKDRRDPLTQ